MTHFVAFDLHSDNACGLIIDQSERIVLKKKFNNVMADILAGLLPFKPTISRIVVEATYNWYWLVDGLMENGYQVVLAHPAGIPNNPGKKHTNDFDDAFHLAQLLKENKLATAYIYPRQKRPQRDLLRKRTLLVREKTRLLLSLVNSVHRQRGGKITTQKAKQLSPGELEAMFNQEHLVLAGKGLLEVTRSLEQQIRHYEKAIQKEVQLLPEFEILQSVPGIGFILAATIVLEVGDIHRFQTVGDYLSYCRLVESKRTSNSKTKGHNNRKNGNAYLCWSYIEAANFTRRYCPLASAYYQRKFNRSRLHVVALMSLAAKIARATYFMIKTHEPYDARKLFQPGSKRLTP